MLILLLKDVMKWLLETKTKTRAYTKIHPPYPDLFLNPPFRVAESRLKTGRFWDGGILKVGS